MTKTKLLVAVDSYLPRWDGIARSLSELLPHMQDLFEIRLVIPDYPGHRPALDGVSFVPLPLIPFLRFGDLGVPIVFPWVIRKQVDWADIVWTHTAVSIGGACIRRAYEKQKPIVSFIHSTEWEVYGKGALVANDYVGRKWLKTARERYGHADLLLTPGETTRKELENNNFEGPIKVTPLGVSPTRFFPSPRENRKSHREELGLPADIPIIGYIGRFSGEKDLGTLIKAHKLLEEKFNAHLLLVGGEQKHLPAINLSSNVTVVGPTAEPHRYYQAMDIYVLPSLTESFSLSLLEAMACGIPPVTTSAGSAPQIIESGKNGYLFEEKNISQLAGIIEELLNDDCKRMSLGEEARKTIEDGFSWENSAKRISSHLEQVLR